jgi:predicted nucleic acid-binding protein
VLLVDSSVWILEERRVVALSRILPADEPVATCPMIVSEVLRGASSQKRYALTREMLLEAELLDSPTPFIRFEEAARLYLTCRADGITVASVDCLIAATAIAHDAMLVHDDSDFDLIAQVMPLKIHRWKPA